MPSGPTDRSGGTFRAPLPEAGDADGGVLGAGTLTGVKARVLWSEGSAVPLGGEPFQVRGLILQVALGSVLGCPPRPPGTWVSPGAVPPLSPGPSGWEGPVSSAPARRPLQTDPSCPSGCPSRPDSPGTWPAGRNPDVNPEALEAFKKFAQRKGLSPEDIFTPEQTGEGSALRHPRVPSASSSCPGSLPLPPPASPRSLRGETSTL